MHASLRIGLQLVVIYLGQGLDMEAQKSKRDKQHWWPVDKEVHSSGQSITRAEKTNTYMTERVKLALKRDNYTPLSSGTLAS